MSDIMKGGAAEVRPYCFDSVAAGPELMKKKKERGGEGFWGVAQDGYMDKVIEDAQKILQAAREKAEVIKNQAYEDGRRDGYETGYREGCEKAEEEYGKRLDVELHQMQDDLEAALAEITLQKEKCMEQYIDSLKNVVLAIGEKIIRTSLQSSGEVIKRMIIAATDKMKRTEWAKIYITKYDYDFMIKADSSLVGELNYLSDNVKLIVMEQGEPGTCIIELPNEIIDASVSTQLENIKDILNNARL